MQNKKYLKLLRIVRPDKIILIFLYCSLSSCYHIYMGYFAKSCSFEITREYIKSNCKLEGVTVCELSVDSFCFQGVPAKYDIVKLCFASLKSKNHKAKKYIHFFKTNSNYKWTDTRKHIITDTLSFGFEKNVWYNIHVSNKNAYFKFNNNDSMILYWRNVHKIW